MIRMIRKIALATALLAFFVVAPALAQPYPSPDQTFYLSPPILKDDSGIQIELNSVVASDVPHGSYNFSFPPTQYRYYTVYYTKFNPTDHDIRYQFNITFVDRNGTVYETEDNILATGIGAGRRISDEPMEFVIPRNATGLYLRWYYINAYTNQHEWKNIELVTEPVATATPTPTAAPSATVASPTPTAAPGATATPKPTPVDGLLPVLAIGIAGAGIAFARGSSKRK